jgi:tRNA pseudouridine55 synthase
LNKIFVAYKPPYLSSGSFLNRIKRANKFTKCGYSGTLDPFASGTLIIATGQYTKLFNYLSLEPKVYRATLWLGAISESLDIEKFEKVDEVREYSIQEIENTLAKFIGENLISPPKFSAKWVDGKRAYKLARNSVEFELEKTVMKVFDIKLLHYIHPLIHFELSVSKGSYIRSIAYHIAKELGEEGILSSLERVSEGEFRYKEDVNSPLDYIKLPYNKYLCEKNQIINGKKLDISELEIGIDGKYILDIEENFAIIEIKDGVVSYLINNMEK